jgi:hypothetical protein
MKTKNYLIILFVLATLHLKAQVTITQADFPTAGTLWIEYFDSRTNVHTITAPGPSQAWNYSTAFLVDDTMAIGFIAPSGTPAGWAANFPASNVASYNPADSAAQFYVSNNTGFYLDGVYSNSSVTPANILDFNPDQLLVPAPFSYNDTRNNTALFVVEQPGTPAFQIKLYFISSFLADAWGSLVTPEGTFPSTLRVKQVSYTIDSTFIDITGSGTYTFLQSNGPTDTTITYTWYTNGPLPILMSISQDPVTLNSTGAEYYSLTPVGFNENSSLQFNVPYPNPAAALIQFDINDEAAELVRIYDMNGKVIREEPVKNLNRLILTTTNFKNGIYFYDYISSSGEVLNKGKFMVAK